MMENQIQKQIQLQTLAARTDFGLIYYNSHEY